MSSPPTYASEIGYAAIHTAPKSDFSLEDFLSSSLATELMDTTVDTGPIDDATNDDGGDEDTEYLIQKSYNAFFGTLPLSTAPNSPTSPRPPSPNPIFPSQSKKRARTPPIPSPTSFTPRESDSSNAGCVKINSTSKSRRDKKKAKSSRKRKRLISPESTKTSTAHTTKTHINNSEGVSTEYDQDEIPSASSGYIAKPDKKGRVYTLPELLAMGFQLVKWDGRTSKPILDKNGLVVAVLVGTPKDSGWDDVCDSACELLRMKAPLFNFTKKHSNHRRGAFPAVNVGISFGGGQMAPGNLCHTKAQTKVLADILQSTCFIRIAGFASRAFAAWMPRVHEYYRRDFENLLDRHRLLNRNFRNSIWAAAALNFGPRTITARHRDFANLPFGICAITALGRFDPTKGGHILLWELGLVIEFPPGSTVLIPSAAISHANTPIAAHEYRSSFTQYSAGGLFRWTQHGFQTDSKFKKGMSDEEKAAVTAENRIRCKLGLSLFPKLSELRNPSKASALSRT